MSIFSPAPHIERLPEAQIDSTYKRLRREVFAGTFIGKVPNNNITKALSNRPTVEKYFGLERSDALPITNLLTP